MFGTTAASRSSSLPSFWHPAEVPGVPKASRPRPPCCGQGGRAISGMAGCAPAAAYPHRGVDRSERELCWLQTERSGLPTHTEVESCASAVAEARGGELVPDEDGISDIAVSEGGEFHSSDRECPRGGPRETSLGGSDSGRIYRDGGRSGP